MRYIEKHRGPAAYVMGPPPSRGRDLELEGGVNACHVEYVYEPRVETRTLFGISIGAFASKEF